ncbi:MAG: hypothetical protein B7Z75_11395 [Acidocella sp. 20-57-95]|nr:MAG: hypothetical protein B7Z75_11395 [Acidocella sp. 20-57-95]HQT64962.1 tripartite tricarboxylate transporter substrate-binding protein [Acidocella sp.]
MSEKIMTRRGVLSIGATFAAGALIGRPHIASAANYPDRPITILIPYGPGGGYDSYAREFASVLTKQMKVNVEPVNLPGGGGAEAIFQLAQDNPTGYHVSLINTLGILLSKNRQAIHLDKLTWIANLGRDPFGLAVSAKSSINTPEDLQKIGASRPISFASSGTDASFFAAKVFCASLGIGSKFISGYKGSVNSAVAVARGDVDAVVYSLSTLQNLQSAGLIRTIFSFEDKSSIPGIEDATSVNKPDLANIYESRPIVAPPGLDPEIATILSDNFVRAANTPEVIAWATKIKTVLNPLDKKGAYEMFKSEERLVDKWQHIF